MVHVMLVISFLGTTQCVRKLPTNLRGPDYLRHVQLQISNRVQLTNGKCLI